ncbi:helix-turn-helix domain-containing protein [Streptomyces sp. 7-21]|uniref:helix-turn-helix domain-containing protein n=1 Tax=Streptomyces sp. 7-21 TaxID=2802283 RepID=UPI00191E5BC0|nr:helix-turn-helix transcriptional regulator [Streptomyces sp. 7-21]MBL1068171.1 helix-turn-helix transcriptional regulator [Streptomyces sp. 7-21]
MSSNASNEARVVPLRPVPPAGEAVREPLWRQLVGDVLRRERLGQERTLKEVAEEARISMAYLSEIERGRKEPSSEVLAAAARALGLGLSDLLDRAQRELYRRRPARAVSALGRAAAARPGAAGRGPVPPTAMVRLAA